MPSFPMSETFATITKSPGQLAVGDQILQAGNATTVVVAAPVPPSAQESRWLIPTDAHPEGTYADPSIRFTIKL
jgi:hypothetical protein